MNPANRSSKRPSALDELTMLVTGARAAAAHLDGPSLDNCMRSLDTWFNEQRGALKVDTRLRAAAMVALREVRDLCAILASAIRDGLSAAAVAEPNAQRYGGRGNTYAATGQQAVLTRRYG